MEIRIKHSLFLKNPNLWVHIAMLRVRDKVEKIRTEAS